MIFDEKMLNLETEYRNRSEGIIYDHFNVAETLRELNDEIDCDDIQFKLNPETCEDDNCKGINQTPSFLVPQCSEDKALVEKNFNNLKQYLNTEGNLLRDMISNLVATVDSPRIKFEESTRVLESARSDFEQANNVLTNSLIEFKNYNATFSQINDCQELRKQLFQWEKSLCWDFGNNLHISFVLSFLGSIVLLLVVWMFFFGFRGNIQKRDLIKIDESKVLKHQTIDKDFETASAIKDFELDDFDDDEKVPVY